MNSSWVSVLNLNYHCSCLHPHLLFLPVFCVGRILHWQVDKSWCSGQSWNTTLINADEINRRLVISVLIYASTPYTILITFLFVKFLTVSRTALGTIQPLIQWVPGAISLAVKRPGRKHSRPSSAEITEWVELYLHSPIRLHGVVLG
jgi:hypothetical protein